ncbi:MAG: hypothetical protein ACTS5F_01490 [Candidatus Hodgkinia cicadicola]
MEHRALTLFHLNCWKFFRLNVRSLVSSITISSARNMLNRRLWNCLITRR